MREEEPQERRGESVDSVTGVRSVSDACASSEVVTAVTGEK